MFRGFVSHGMQKPLYIFDCTVFAQFAQYLRESMNIKCVLQLAQKEIGREERMARQETLFTCRLSCMEMTFNLPISVSGHAAAFPQRRSR